MKIIIAVIIILLLWLGYIIFWPKLYGVGDSPDFALPSIDGRMVCVSDFKGRVVFVDFFFPDDVSCPNAQTAFETEKKLAEQFDRTKVVFLSISLMSDLDAIRNYVAKKDKGSIVLFDPGEKVYGKFYSRGFPPSYTFPAYIVFDKTGKIVFSSRHDKGRHNNFDFYYGLLLELLSI